MVLWAGFYERGCQGKTSPWWQARVISSTASPQLTRKPRWHDGVADLLDDAPMDRRLGLVLFKARRSLLKELTIVLFETSAASAFA
jgi:hypothetical protein